MFLKKARRCTCNRPCEVKWGAYQLGDSNSHEVLWTCASATVSQQSVVQVLWCRLAHTASSKTAKGLTIVKCEKCDWCWYSVAEKNQQFFFRSLVSFFSGMVARSPKTIKFKQFLFFRSFIPLLVCGFVVSCVRSFVGLFLPAWSFVCSLA